MAKERLDKILANMGCGSRKEVGIIVKLGRVRVNDNIITNPAHKITPSEDRLAIDGKQLRFKIGRYYMLNKPPDLVSACVDNIHQTVLSVFPEKQRKGLFPVGRLDKDTEGLLIITDDGDFCHAVMSPKHNINKVYKALVSGEIQKDAVKIFKEGIVLADGTKCKSANLEILDTKNNLTEIKVTISEGKHHQVKRMVAAVGGHVEYLKRISIGSLKLDDNLKSGQYRELTESEVDMLRNEADVK